MLSVFRWQDVADIIIMSFLAYQLYSWFKNTKAMQVLLGMAFLGCVYFITRNLGLFMTSWILQELGTVLFVLIIVIFQNEIRQALYRFSLLRNLFGRQAHAPQLDLKELSDQVFELAEEKTGAIIVFQRAEPLDEYLLHGVALDSLVSGQLIGSIFQNGTPLHDGALVIRDGRMVCASCHLPLSAKSEIPQYFGTRHRAAIGISERTDAVVVVVSEERGRVSLAINGELQQVDTAEQLSSRLNELLYPPTQDVTGDVVKARLVSNFFPKMVTVLVVVAAWLVITSRQGGIYTVTAPIKFHNLPASAALMKSTPEEVEVQLKVISNLIPSPKQLDIYADLDLAGVREGSNHLAIGKDNFKLPLGVVATSVNPSMVKVVIDKKVSKSMRVRVKTTGMLKGGRMPRNISVDPATVMVEGPERLLGQYEEIITEELGLSGVIPGTQYEKKLLAPTPLVRILHEDPVKIRVYAGGRKK